jgi:hypothetical protein
MIETGMGDKIYARRCLTVSEENTWQKHNRTCGFRCHEIIPGIIGNNKFTNNIPDNQQIN